LRGNHPVRLTPDGVVSHVDPHGLPLTVNHLWASSKRDAVYFLARILANSACVSFHNSMPTLAPIEA
jgi:hypothetical protein